MKQRGEPLKQAKSKTRTPVPRGLGRTGPVILSYGFRPFFLAAGIWGTLAMALWTAALGFDLEIGSTYGRAAWHAHEMLFGYSSAALAGFLLTAVPNWTGRLPVAGLPLAGLLALWVAGRLVLLCPDVLGLVPSTAIDAAFLPTLLAVCSREIIAGKKWKDLKILAGIAVLACANASFHLCNLAGWGTELSGRGAVAGYTVLIMIIGGRILPSFTRNWLAKNGASRFPAPYGHFDTLAIAVGVVALASWVWSPETLATGTLGLAAGLLHLVRLYRWRGWECGREPLVLVLHLAYGFIATGLIGIGAAALGYFQPIAALHILTVGGIGTMTLAVMSRASRGHTGLTLRASLVTVCSYVAIAIATLLRPIAWILPDSEMMLLEAAGCAWVIAFALFTFEYAPILLFRRKELPISRVTA
ncbi:MAG: NnrS family protein [Devosia sp.]